jgi:sulfur relay (sulfurtransferase) DsrC/TusE family protein
MPIITLAGKQCEVDEKGFLEDRATWTEEVARGLAAVLTSLENGVKAP